MYKPDMARARTFWSTLQDCWIKLYGSPFPTAAAINGKSTHKNMIFFNNIFKLSTGHAPAGGCLISMCCEYRVMLPKFTIGLNETQLGMIAPNWFMATMKNTISSRQAELALTLGRLFKTDEALNIGLVDEVAESKKEAIAKCEAFLNKYKKIPAMARAITKQNCRQKDIAKLDSDREADIQLFMKSISDQRIQTTIGNYLAALKKSR
jgi:3,2-trans-enoyl-CoA isomerase